MFPLPKIHIVEPPILKLGKLTAQQVLDYVLEAMASKCLNQRWEFKIVHDIKRELQIQFIHQLYIRHQSDISLVSKLCEDVKVDVSGTTLLLDIHPSWIKNMDLILGTKECPYCAHLIPDRTHPREECDQNVVQGIMES